MILYVAKLRNRIRDEWELLWKIEKLLFKDEPSNSEEMVETLANSCKKFPEIATWYTSMDGVGHQLSRDALAIFMQHEWLLPEKGENDVTEILRKTFAGPSSTKTWTEDVLRDMRHTLKQHPANKVNPWARQKAALESIFNRDKEKIMPIVNPVSQQSLSLFNRFEKKKLITTSIFSPLTNRKKAKNCMEQGKPFDVGFSEEEIEPLVDLSPLMEGQGRKKKGMRVNEQREKDCASVFLQPASKLASYQAAAAYAALICYKKDIEEGNWVALESKLGKRWMGQLLHLGQVYTIDGQDGVCLGFHRHCALFWPLKRKTVLFADGSKALVFSMTQVA